MSVENTSMSAPAAMAEGMARRRSMAWQKPPMMVASVVMRPLKPSSPRRTPVSSSRLREAGRTSEKPSAGFFSMESAGWQMWPTMTDSRPRSMRAL